ncbi:MAG: prepilin peptidase [Candidatus Komeilibacteria bacterium]|nr:prepilin peptidase [Candidatus Komeilibacteria bacterium]
MLAVLIFILGLIFGSFLNAVIFRLKRNEQFIRGRSKCLSCKHNLAWQDLIPLFSFIFLRAKCRYCKAKISWQYPAVELATALVFLIGYWHYLNLTDYSVYLVFSCFLIIIFVFDFKYYLILDKVSLSALMAAFVFNFLLGYSAINLLIGALAVAGFFLLQFVVSQGAWIGGGDLRLGLVMGAMLGWPMALVALSLAYLSGAAAGLILIVFKKKRFNSQLPFGTFLSLATWVTLLWGEKILSWYLNTML